tara:strand:+ start:1258 stop:1500 length:243 start_codon:yes stop_codon:yes gene_type:complete
MSTQKERILSGLLRGKKLTVRDMLFSPYNSNCPPRRIKDLSDNMNIKIEREEKVKDGTRFTQYYLSKSEIRRLKDVRKNS